MSRKFRLQTAILATFLIVAILGGCSKTNIGEDVATTKSTAATSTSASTSATTSTAVDRELVGNTYKTGLPIVKDKETISVCINHHPLDKSANYDEKALVKQLEEKTNIHIEWIEIPNAQLAEKIPLLLASDLPDVFLNDVISEANFMKNLDSFIPLEDLAKEWCPNTVRDYEIGLKESGYDAWKILTQPDGHIHSLMGGGLTGNSIGGIPIVNQTWLDNLQLKMPTTLDEYYNMLVAFKTKDANGNGDAKDEIPLEFCENYWASPFIQFAGPWGFTDFYDIQNGKVIPTMDSQACREWLDFYHKLAKEGLIDVEGFSMTNEQYNSKLKQGIVGSYYCFTPIEQLEGDLAKQYTMMPQVAAPGYEGKQRILGNMNMFSGQKYSFIITTACKNPTAMLRWWDLNATDTRSKFTYMFGPDITEGGVWEERPDGFYNVLEGNYTAEWTVYNAKYTYKIGNSCPLCTEKEKIKNDGVKYPDTVIRQNMEEAVSKYVSKESLPPQVVPVEKSTEYALKTTDLVTYMKSFIANSVMNGVTDKSWAAHIKKLKDLNYDFYISYYQGYIDGEWK